jgi:hypothetical protein
MGDTRDVVAEVRAGATCRDYRGESCQVCALLLRAADEIEALRAEVERLRSSLAMRDEVLHRPRRRPSTP